MYRNKINSEQVYKIIICSQQQINEERFFIVDKLIR
jgi:hypothetical protein